MKILVTMFKILFITLKNPPKQDFVNELYVHEQAKHYQRHFGIGDGGKSLEGKYINHNTRIR